MIVGEEGAIVSSPTDWLIVQVIIFFSHVSFPRFQRFERCYKCQSVERKFQIVMQKYRDARRTNLETSRAFPEVDTTSVPSQYSRFSTVHVRARACLLYFLLVCPYT